MTDLDRLESAALELIAAYNACGFGGDEDRAGMSEQPADLKR